MGIFEDVIKKPTDKNVSALLAVKIKQYDNRMEDPDKTDVSFLDAYCKRSLCQLILEQEQVTTNDFVVAISQLLTLHLSPDQLEGKTVEDTAKVVAVQMMNYAIRAWAVINDYCQTGGKQTKKNNPRGFLLN